VAKRKDALLTTFGRRVKRVREDHGWTQEVLAEHASLDRSYIAGIEAGLRNPSVTVVAKLARGLDVSLSELFKDVR
jgi:transcriptional regulator with XRE-family HTH domain